MPLAGRPGLAGPPRRKAPIAARDGRQTCPTRPMRLASPSGRPNATPGTAWSAVRRTQRRHQPDHRPALTTRCWAARHNGLRRQSSHSRSAAGLPHW